MPSRGWPHQCCQQPVAPLWRCIVTPKRGREKPSSGGTSFLEWWHFFCTVPDRPCPDSCIGVGESWYTIEVLPSQMGKTVSVMTTIKMYRSQLCLTYPLTSLKLEAWIPHSIWDCYHARFFFLPTNKTIGLKFSLYH